MDDEFCEEMRRVGNLSLSISLEGFEEVNDMRRGEGVFDKVMAAMDRLKKYGLIFGTSICYTRKNIETVTSDEYDHRKGMSFHLVFPLYAGWK